MELVILWWIFPEAQFGTFSKLKHRFKHHFHYKHHPIITFSLPSLPFSLSSAGFVEGNRGNNSLIHIWKSVCLSVFFFWHIIEWMCHCIFWFSDCSSCYQFDNGVAIGIITCDIILTLLIALSVYCFVSHQKRKGSLHTHARCCGSGMPACKRNQKLCYYYTCSSQHDIIFFWSLR